MATGFSKDKVLRANGSIVSSGTVFITTIMICLFSENAMETDEGEKEVPAKKPKTEPVLVRHLTLSKATK